MSRPSPRRGRRAALRFAWLAGAIVAIIVSAPLAAVDADADADADIDVAVDADAGAAPALAVLPAAIALHGPESRHALLVEWMLGDEARGPALDAGLTVTSSDDGVARVEPVAPGVVTIIPVGDGSATITAALGERRAAARVDVGGMDAPAAWSFRNDVQPVLTKRGCNSGACHGALAGQNGFRLSLRGYDVFGDHATLTRDARGRRIVPEDPGRSLLLTKPAAIIAHKGGKRFDVRSRDFRAIAGWIAQNTPAPRRDDPVVERIEVLPALTVLAPGDERQLLVRARFSDGSARDVTALAKLTGTDDAVLRVDVDTGRVAVRGPGEAAVTAWYQSKIAVATVSVPFAGEVAAAAFDAAPRRNFIDDIILDKLRRLRLPPSPRASDAAFIRRAFLDTIGVLPTADETRAFLADPSADKRDRLIAGLFERPEFVDYQTYRLGDLFLVSTSPGQLAPPAMWAFHGWLRSQVAANAPWDELARGIVTARGDTLENGAANFFVLHKDPLAMAETTSVAFLGMSINCARCHNHPMEKWTNDQYYGMASLFARVRSKDAPGAGNATIFTAARGEVIQPLTGKAQPPAPLDGEPLDEAAGIERRAHLARWLTAPENPYFSRAIANRIWARFLGAGLVEPVDDMRLTNPASNEKLLDALAAFLRERGYDLRALMRLILESETYQRSSEPLGANRDDRRFFSRYLPRRLEAEVLLDAISAALEAPTAFPGYPAGWRALQLPDSNVPSYFLQSFGRADRVITCECERSNEPSMAQVLHLANGDTVNEKLRAAGNVVERLLGSGASARSIVETAYLSALSRPPGEDELRRVLEVVAADGEAPSREAIEDLYWSVLTSREFIFQR